MFAIDFYPLHIHLILRIVFESVLFRLSHALPFSNMPFLSAIGSNEMASDSQVL